MKSILRYYLMEWSLSYGKSAQQPIGCPLTERPNPIRTERQDGFQQLDELARIREWGTDDKSENCSSFFRRVV